MPGEPPLQMVPASASPCSRLSSSCKETALQRISRKSCCEVPVQASDISYQLQDALEPAINATHENPGSSSTPLAFLITVQKLSLSQPCLPMRSAASSHGVVARRSAKPPILPGVVHSASRRAVQQTLQPPPALETEKREDRAGEWQVLQIVRTDEPESPALTVVRRGPQQDAAAAASVSSSSENDDSTMAPQQTAAANPGQKLLAGARSLFVPDGWPASTTPDYMPYQLWALPTHVLGSLLHSLTTSSLLQAVGVSAGPVATTAAGAALKWITKDGLGAMGRFLVGGGLAPEFDRDPRRWRMVGELCTATGAGLEIATAIFPQAFIPLATTGRFAKALGKSIGKPVFRVIQTHFARDNNVGAVAAKEEVWEVVAQLSGYALSIAVLAALDDIVRTSGVQGEGAGAPFVAVWAAIQASHICLRYKSLSVLVFTSLNEARLRMLAHAHVRGQPLGTPEEINKREPFLPIQILPAELSQPSISIGQVGLEEALGPLVLSSSSSTCQGSSLPSLQGGDSHSSRVSSSNGGEAGGQTSRLAAAAVALLEMYRDEGHVLVWRDGGAFVLLKEGAGPQAVLRAVWQASWLHVHSSREGDVFLQHSYGDSARRVPGSSASNGNSNGDGSSGHLHSHSNGSSNMAVKGHHLQQQHSSTLQDPELHEHLQLELLQASVAAVRDQFPRFCEEARQLGWEVDNGTSMAVGPLRLRVVV